ncbi:MAG: DUF5407 domain-containing protein [Chlamydiia bacterium]|nr:DUF5407 domain-containing protein [Chlamydiia bacterium]
MSDPQSTADPFKAPNPWFSGLNRQNAFLVSALFDIVNEATVSARAKLLVIQERRSAISIGDMFEMQMLMNHLSQLSEMSTSVVAATNTAIMSMARNVKG